MKKAEKYFLITCAIFFVQGTVFAQPYSVQDGSHISDDYKKVLNDAIYSHYTNEQMMELNSRTMYGLDVSLSTSSMRVKLLSQRVGENPTYSFVDVDISHAEVTRTHLSPTGVAEDVGSNAVIELEDRVTKTPYVAKRVVITPVPRMPNQDTKKEVVVKIDNEVVKESIPWSSKSKDESFLTKTRTKVSSLFSSVYHFFFK